MNEIARIAVAVAVLLPCHQVAAQMYKCTDAAGRISYSSTECSALGLKDVGEVKDRLNTSPAYKPPPGSTRSSPSSAAPVPSAPAAAAPPSEPDRRCFTTTVKGKSVTRCNDKPDEE
jgi:hypothetical protein